ncbi:MAG: HD domain-containing protein [Fusobacteriaceae bacterium]
MITSKVISRIKQLYTYIFGEYNKEWEGEIKKILNLKEFEIYINMIKYDRIHGYIILKKILLEEELKNNKQYQKLALLHDCGKEKIGLFKRVKKVLVGDKKLEKHSEISYRKLKKINIELAVLCKNHHTKEYDENMSIFQKLDDE